MSEQLKSDAENSLNNLLQIFNLSMHEYNYEKARLEKYFDASCANISIDEFSLLPKYVFAATSRVGGHVMSQLMHCLGSGNPHEYFSDYHLNIFSNQHPEVKPLLSDYWAYLFRQSSSEGGGDGVFGLKTTLSNLLPYIYYKNFPYGFKA